MIIQEVIMKITKEKNSTQIITGTRMKMMLITSRAAMMLVLCK